MVSNRLLSTDEMWLVQGFPRPCAPGVPERLTAEFPFDVAIHPGSSQGDVQMICKNEQSLIANCMWRR
eukprot:2962856-Pyramimonas_sp.AAC.1